jgi:hypothetical protein
LRYDELLVQLVHRASKEYDGPDAIRTKDGNASANYTKTRQWETAFAMSGAGPLRLNVDQKIQKSDPIWAEASACEVYRQSWSCMKDYNHPALITEILSVELPFSGVRYPLSDEALVGIVDLVGRTADGSLVIVDHKTTAHPHRDTHKIRFDSQLLLYGWAYEQMTGQTVKYVGKNFLRSGWLVMAEWDADLAMEDMMRREMIVTAIRSGVFIRQNPADYGSRCGNCEFQSYCHPAWKEAA